MKCMKLYFENEVYPLSDISNWSIISSLGGNKTMQFDISPHSDMYKYIEEEGRIEYNGTYYNIKSINERRTAATINAEIDLDGLKGKIFQKFQTTTISLAQTLSLALDGTGWSVAGAGLISSKRSLDLTDVTPLDIINQCTNKTIYNVSFDIDNINKILNISVPSAVSENIYFTDRLNLKELNFKGSSNNFITRLYAYGKDGLSVESVNDGKEYIDDNSYSNKIISAVWRDERYTDASNLLKDAKEKLKENAVPERSYTCDIIDLARLNKTEYSDFYIRLNSIIILIDRRRKKRLEHTVVEIKEYPNEPVNNTVTLSTTPQKLSKKLLNTSIQISNISNSVNKQPSQWEKAVANATALITGQKGGYVVLNPSEKPNEILIMDTDNINTATKVWRWNSAGLGYSSTGYNGEFALAMTIDGRIVADFITAGGMNAERINTGTLQGIRIIAETGSIAGWLMQNNKLVSSDGRLRIDSSNNRIDLYSSGTDDSYLMASLYNQGLQFYGSDNKYTGEISRITTDSGDGVAITLDEDNSERFFIALNKSGSGGITPKLGYIKSDDIFKFYCPVSLCPGTDFNGHEIKIINTEINGQSVGLLGWLN